MCPPTLRTLRDGYTIVHKGILCHSLIPSPKKLARVRALYLALEATFTFAFWAMKSKSKYCMDHMLSWDIDELEYDSLCSHSSLAKGLRGDSDLTPEEQEV